MKNKNIDVNRRTFLKSATVATVSAGVIGTVSGDRNPDQVRFIEAGVLHNVSDPEVLKYANMDTVCSPPEYDIHPISNTLRINPQRITSGDKSLLDNQNTVIYSQGFNTETTPVSGSTEHSVVTELTPRYQPQSVIRLDEPYKEPELTVKANEEIVVETPYSEKTLEPGDELQHLFSKRNITVKMERATDDLVEKREGMEEWQRSIKMEKWAEEIQVRPEVLVRDYGILEVEFL